MVIIRTSKIKQLESWKINIHMYKKGLQYTYDCKFQTIYFMYNNF
jgi:hypothetical protein